MNNLISHKKIKDFSLDGQIYDESHIMRLRTEYSIIMDHYMRLKGYVPHLDLDTCFSVSYNGHSFDFKITTYGVYIGKAKAQCFKGVVGNKLLPMISTTQIKSQKSSASVESQLEQS